MPKIKKLLVANRGEISLRIMRTAREMGIQTVAVYSEADRLSPHVIFADEAVCLGPPPSAQSYLLGDKIIAACRELGVDAIHPGYGFLSENAAFARQVMDAGLIFVGPSASSIEVMGSKLAAKQAVAKYKIPLVPGTEEAITDIAEAKARASEIGYPILIKASAGGGGKGMRIVEDESEFEDQMQRAVSEAQSSFGDSAVFIEKYITSPRHIEIQILGDQHGKVVYLFERECSIQRRHQKVIEEAPSAVVSPEMRRAMGEAAVGVARACDYYGAGTVEFIVDENLDFYFLEMNTRLQVEHPVTEMITGKDLVREQILIAEGESLSFTQDELYINGHALEVRVYAEDPANNFLPDIGKLTTYKRPQGPGVRVDDGFEEGMDIPIYYDPMIAKLVTYGSDRAAAIQRMVGAIEEYKITGIQTTLGFCKFAIQHEAFVSGQFDTKFVDEYFDPKVLSQDFTELEEEILAALAVEFIAKEKKGSAKPSGRIKDSESAWRNRLK
ncbi:acetyl-CoA carboxylase biotin carboxylase subunit [Algoriphagus halophytocola]|uniref:Acetyl-CoA carboxylase biotin carboxylase subunit n=1 Tax=Algoriphagus halophytocola TaxID=2991499 RepID=A0ABY6MH73_9BACT|nr:MULTISPECIES: acetyl-CoA carboxylase biotin carboxylase subunit [unclassified Algoriphagus]UZD23142.1 acetyl-CoA carboxylase biotin carboxylase subunit [Algoriphagus sp. TR-M5]WBL44434.1 acetyl-CoA carboxylase biotin carboxylase subunit [Algoriphagus sp. TR-M9]